MYKELKVTNTMILLQKVLAINRHYLLSLVLT
jgi:hypothetical protein